MAVHAPAAGPALARALATINAPRPVAIDAATLLRCVKAKRPEPRWFPHMEALFDEVSADTLHDLVLAGVTSFEEFDHAARTWRITDARTLPWIREMAGLGLERTAARGRRPG